MPCRLEVSNPTSSSMAKYDEIVDWARPALRTMSAHADAAEVVEFVLNRLTGYDVDMGERVF